MLVTHAEIQDVLGALYELGTNYDCPFDVQSKMRQGVRILKPLADDLEDRRVELVNKYAARDDDGEKVVDQVLENGNQIYKLEHREEFAREWAEARAVKVEVDWSFPAIMLERFRPRPKAVLSFRLTPLLTEDEPQVKTGKKKK